MFATTIRVGLESVAAELPENIVRAEDHAYLEPALRNRTKKIRRTLEHTKKE